MARIIVLIGFSLLFVGKLHATSTPEDDGVCHEDDGVCWQRQQPDRSLIQFRQALVSRPTQSPEVAKILEDLNTAVKQVKETQQDLAETAGDMKETEKKQEDVVKKQEKNEKKQEDVVEETKKKQEENDFDDLKVSEEDDDDADDDITTESTKKIAAGATKLKVADTSIFKEGQGIVINPGKPDQESNVIAKKTALLSTAAAGPIYLKYPVRSNFGKGTQIEAIDKFSGDTAPLNKRGFKAVKKLCCSPQMMEFIRRLIKFGVNEGRKELNADGTPKFKRQRDVCLENGLKGLTWWFDCSWETGDQDWKSLKWAIMSKTSLNRVGKCPWIGFPKRWTPEGLVEEQDGCPERTSCLAGDATEFPGCDREKPEDA